VEFLSGDIFFSAKKVLPPKLSIMDLFFEDKLINYLVFLRTNFNMFVTSSSVKFSVSIIPKLSKLIFSGTQMFPNFHLILSLKKSNCFIANSLFILK
jgi:hypothetical protein